MHTRLRLIDDDDLLKGFDETGPARGHYQGFFATAIVTSLWAWELAFQLGAHRTVFFHTRERLLVVSTVLLLGALILRRRIRVHNWVLVVLSLPILLVLLRLVVPAQPRQSPWPQLVTEAGPVARVAEGVIVAAMILASPATLWVVARLLAPEYFVLPGRRIKVGLMLIVVVVAVMGYLVGRYNYRLLTCEEFLVAGDDAPKNCGHEQ